MTQLYHPPRTTPHPGAHLVTTLAKAAILRREMSPPGLNKRQEGTEDRGQDWVLRGLSETFWRLHEQME